LTNKNTPRGQPLGLNRNQIRNKTENPWNFENQYLLIC
jgi:hypothetical protein